MKLITAVVLATGLFGGVAQAAESCGNTTAMLSGVNGGVLVNTGSGFVPAAPGAVLHTGDQVMVKGQGSAVLDYGKGQVASMASSSSMIVRGKPCGTVAAATSTGSFIDDNRYLIGGGLLLGGGVTAAIIASNRRSSHSP